MVRGSAGVRRRIRVGPGVSSRAPRSKHATPLREFARMGWARRSISNAVGFGISDAGGAQVLVRARSKRHGKQEKDWTQKNKANGDGGSVFRFPKFTICFTLTLGGSLPLDFRHRKTCQYMYVYICNKRQVLIIDKPSVSQIISAHTTVVTSPYQSNPNQVSQSLESRTTNHIHMMGPYSRRRCGCAERE